MINVREKGVGGERELATHFNKIIDGILEERGIIRDVPHVQRNQNQSAVGGFDLVGTFCFAIEIKRCETLEIEKWWKQCTKAAEQEGKLPVLIFRQNGKKWRVITMGGLMAPGIDTPVLARVEISLESFNALFWRIAKVSL